MLKRISNLLRQIFRSNAPAQRDERAEVAARLEQNVLALVGNMPTLPAIATRAMAMADDPQVAFADFARLIDGDVAIATALLRIANSAFFGGGPPASRLEQGVVRLGMFQCKNLILAVGMKSLLWKMVGEEKAQCEVLWHHGNLTGGLCYQLSRRFRLMLDDTAFAAGLLHDLGRILLLLADPACFAKAGAGDFVESPGVLERERLAIGIDHCALGGWFGEHSNLPEPLLQAMRFHHDPAAAGDGRPLVALVAAADHMANHLQRGEATESYNSQDNVGLVYLCERWPAARKKRLLGELLALLEESRQAAAGEPSGV
jgi:HD-like signal output (HDOD) protein